MGHYLMVFLKPKSMFPADIQSDTIAGGLIQACSVLYGSDKADAIVMDKGFRVSSGFPFVEDGDERHLFYPKPLLEPEAPRHGDQDYMDKLKEYNKKTRFVHEEIFRDIIGKKVGESDIINGLIDKAYKIKCGLLFQKSAELSFDISTDITPHNTINRLTSESVEFFYQDGARYRNCGIYFLLETDSPDTMRELKGAIEFLSDGGFGGGISTGGGQFKVEFDEFDGFRGDGEVKILLSLYNPSPEELAAIDIKNSYYRLEKRRGVTTTGKLRKSVMMFAPGSVLRTDADLKGRAHMVSEDPPNVEWGLYMGVGMDG